jgi:mannose-6-phosphate isomerase
VINFEQVEPRLSAPRPLGEEAGVRRELLCQNQYFTTERVFMDTATRFRGRLDGKTFEIWGALEGRVRVNDVALKAVQFCLLPAALGPYTITAETPATLLRSYVS